MPARLPVGELSGGSPTLIGAVLSQAAVFDSGPR